MMAKDMLEMMVTKMRGQIRLNLIFKDVLLG